jgi:hypothetical protein
MLKDPIIFSHLGLASLLLASQFANRSGVAQRSLMRDIELEHDLLHMWRMCVKHNLEASV